MNIYFLLFFLLFLNPLSSAPSLSWNAPTTLYSSSDFDGIMPRLSLDYSVNKATVAWIADGDSSIVYSASYQWNWGVSKIISNSMTPKSALKLVQNPSHSLFAIWNAQVGSDVYLQSSINTGSGWRTPQTVQNLGEIEIETALNLSATDNGAFLLSWQDLDDNFVGVAYLLGSFTSPFFISADELYVLQGEVSRGQVVFATTDGLYQAIVLPATPSTALERKASFPRTIVASSLHLDVTPNFSNIAFVFQDGQTKFLIAAIEDERKPFYTTIAIPQEPVVFSRVSISPIDKLPAVVWQLSSGKIQAARFDGHRWVNHVTLSELGSDPAIAFNPVTNHPIVIWADLEAGGNENTIKVAEFNRSHWTTPLSISLGGESVSDPQIGVTKQGQAFAIWKRTPTEGDKSVIEVAESIR